MSSPLPTAGERRPANLVALQQSLKEIAAKTKRAASATKEKPVGVQEPVLVIKGK